VILDILSWICLLTGGALGIVGGIGIHRFPDFYSRLHAAGITDSICATLILFGLGLQAGWSIAAFKLALIFVFLFFTNPTAAHALANAAQHSGLKPRLGSDEREVGS
jgi:multicomponent Na+:H+ antiporter subunit G